MSDAAPKKTRKKGVKAKVWPSPSALGRKSSYDPSYDEMVTNLYLLGMTDVEVATFFGVTVQAVFSWSKRSDAFRQARADGKERADGKVAAAFYKRALGYSHEAVKIMAPSQAGGAVIRETYTQHYPPDTQAAILWLANRQPGRWKTKPGEAENSDADIPIRIEGGLPERDDAKKST